MRATIVHKNQNTLPPRLRSKPYHEVEVCRGREVSEAKVIMGPFFDKRADTFWKVLARDHFVSIGTLPSANSKNMKRVVRLETSVCFRITRLMNNQTKSRRKAALHQKGESDDKNAVATVRSVSQNGFPSRKTRTHWFLKVENSLGETRCRRSWNQFEGYDSPGLRYVKQVSGKRKDHRLEKYKSKILISEVPTLWNVRTGHMYRLRDSSDVLKARLWILANNRYKLKEKDKDAFFSPAEKWVLPVASTKEPDDREFVVGSGASMHMVSENLNSAELAWGLQGVRRRWWRPTARCKQEKKRQKLYHQNECTCKHTQPKDAATRSPWFRPRRLTLIYHQASS